jgi:hypothetical protein
MRCRQASPRFICTRRTREFHAQRQTASDCAPEAPEGWLPEFLDIFIGNPFAEPGLADWRIDTRGLNAGDVLAITIAVPEPGAVALVLSALLALVAVRARRGRR